MPNVLYTRYNSTLNRWNATLYGNNGVQVEMPTETSTQAVFDWVATQTGLSDDEVKGLISPALYSNSWTEL